jgi:thiamine-monophosphate kinase
MNLNLLINILSRLLLKKLKTLKMMLLYINQNLILDIVISTDSLAEGIHFFGNENPRDIAKKCLRVNLSDMAAMGAKPVFYNLSISVPKNKANIFIPAFAKGLKEDQEAYNIKLIGGDLTASLKHINITITIFGETPPIMPYQEMEPRSMISYM